MRSALPPFALALALAAGGAAAQSAAPPLPGETGPGSLPQTRAAARMAEAEATGTPLAEPAAPPIRLGDFGLPITGTPAASAEPDRAWTIVPSIGVQALATDNAEFSATRKHADVITTVTPGLLVSADTARLQGVLNYRPTARFYADDSEQNRLDHSFNGQALVGVVPGVVFLDLRGASSLQSVSGGRAAGDGASDDERDVLQTTSFQVSPYIVHRFGDTATVQIGYAFQSVDQSGEDTRIGVQPGLDGAPLGNAAQSFTAHQGYAVVRSGPDFGRLALEGRLEATSYIGTGVLDDAYRRIGTLQARYAILRGVAVLVEGGYEQQRYAGTPGIAIDEPIWAVGVQFTLANDGRVTLRYGRRDGVNAFSLDASVPVGGRTRLSARYGEQLTTNAQQAADLLSTTSLDRFGNPIDLQTGLPQARPFSGSLLGTQNNLARVRTASLGIVQTWPRDIFALTVTREERIPVSSAEGGTGFAQRGTSASFTWSHSLTPRTDAIAYVQYGRSSSDLRGDGSTAAASLSLVHQLREKLTATVQVGTSLRDYDDQDGRAVQNFILIGLRQTF
ncbi:TIGR03016 family PEP-CTERM system-associated outer membrane protein [Falsiroseomonas selenitidurans]|uniref:TIGR03016 family PEP-CTERM system-associated outer membrane protein n=1 Tax=Falsiroseomonas selenitidurans TaxID=2716335 RepID=A0ABX1E424_9PROT|nr:TIGR03016 family PEP-CTERM system-associated outer membrane protein [Falsiroseomonas selenitidurans]NKC30563.1 TIGR03016 family PEP-CTERM system-associated outer membrane protein [Falsiroseomonas selenitidurans]